MEFGEFLWLFVSFLRLCVMMKPKEFGHADSSKHASLIKMHIYD